MMIAAALALVSVSWVIQAQSCFAVRQGQDISIPDEIGSIGGRV
jgi:hypothetical protein